MSGSVEKISVGLGHRGNAPDASPAFCGVPGPLGGGGTALLPEDMVTFLGESLFNNTPDQAVQRVNLSARRGDRVQAISIAPDSPIESCDIFIGEGGLAEGNRHRVAVGAPFIGEIDSDTIFVCATRAIPSIDGSNGAASGVLVWEGRRSAVEDPFGFAAFELPVKLNLYRGTARPWEHTKRAPYHANALFDLRASDAGPGSSYDFYVIVDGRRRFDVIAHLYEDAGSNECNLRVRGVEAGKMNPAALDPTVDFATFDELLAVTALVPDDAIPLVYSYQGNPYFMVCISLSNVQGPGYIQVNAWDD